MNLKALLYATFNLCILCTEKFHHNWQVYIGVQNERNKVFFIILDVCNSLLSNIASACKAPFQYNLLLLDPVTNTHRHRATICVVLLLFSAAVAVRDGFASGASVQSFNPKEPARPAMITSVPGPKSQELLKELNAIQASA